MDRSPAGTRLRVQWVRWVFSVPYFIVFLTILVYVLARLLFWPHNSEFAGLHLVLVTWPWGFLVLESDLPPAPVLTLVLLSLAGAMNTALLWVSGWLIDRTLSGHCRQRRFPSG